MSRPRAGGGPKRTTQTERQRFSKNTFTLLGGVTKTQAHPKANNSPTFGTHGNPSKTQSRKEWSNRQGN